MIGLSRQIAPCRPTKGGDGEKVVPTMGREPNWGEVWLPRAWPTTGRCRRPDHHREREER